MTVVAMKESGVATPARRLRGRLFDPGELSLDDLLSTLSESLARTGSARCPVCGGRLFWDAAEQASSCSGCGSSLE